MSGDYPVFAHEQGDVFIAAVEGELPRRLALVWREVKALRPLELLILRIHIVPDSRHGDLPVGDGLYRLVSAKPQKSRNISVIGYPERHVRAVYGDCIGSGGAQQEESRRDEQCNAQQRDRGQKTVFYLYGAEHNITATVYAAAQEVMIKPPTSPARSANIVAPTSAMLSRVP